MSEKVYQQVDDAINRGLHLAYVGKLQQTWHQPLAINLGMIQMCKSDCGTAWDSWEITVEEWVERVRECGLWRNVGMWNFVPADDPAASTMRQAHRSPGWAGREVYRLRIEVEELKRQLQEDER